MSKLLMIDGEKKVGLDFVADLYSGRVHKTLDTLYRQLEELQQGIETMTQNEQKILDAASVIATLADTFAAQIEAMKAKIETLTAQAQSPVAHETEDLSEEMAALESSLASLNAVTADFGPEEAVDIAVPVETDSTEAEAPAVTVDPPAPGLTVVRDEIAAGDGVGEAVEPEKVEEAPTGVSEATEEAEEEDLDEFDEEEDPEVEDESAVPAADVVDTVGDVVPAPVFVPAETSAPITTETAPVSTEEVNGDWN